MKNRISNRAKNFSLRWLPPATFVFFYRFLRWWRLSSYIKNWHLCWLRHQLIMSRSAFPGDLEASYKNGVGKGLVEVRYKNGIRYKTTGLGLETVFSERDYFEKFSGEIHRVAVSQMPAVGKIHRQDRIARRQHRKIDGRVCLGT